MFVHVSIWSRHVIVRYSLFSLSAYSAEHRKSFYFIFFIFSAEQFRRIPSKYVIKLLYHWYRDMTLFYHVKHGIIGGRYDKAHP